MSKPFSVNQSLMRPPLIMGVERRLAGLIAAVTLAFLALGGLGTKTLAVIALVAVLGLYLGRKAAGYDTDTVGLFLAGLAYRDFYEPLGGPRSRPINPGRL